MHKVQISVSKYFLDVFQSTLNCIKDICNDVDEVKPFFK